ncbi:MAG: hypothetical protein QOF36_2539 [Microbacteriaceae bacterium]|nr:hypothetical protein [Microbacteriaceae bacterium]
MADYFQRILPDLAQVERVYKLFVEVEAELVTAVRVSPDPAVRRTAQNQARLVRRAYQQFQEDLIALAQRCAEVANEEVMRLYQDARTPRGDTGNPPHLSEALPTSEAVPTPVPAGVVGITRLDALEKFEYWKAQEFGLDEGFVGREVKGWFFGTGFSGPISAPDPGQSQNHPLFRPSSTGRTMHIQNPIEPGHFLTDTVRTVEALWLKLMNESVRDVVRDLDAALGQARPSGYREGVLRRGARRR